MSLRSMDSDPQPETATSKRSALNDLNTLCAARLSGLSGRRRDRSETRALDEQTDKADSTEQDKLGRMCKQRVRGGRGFGDTEKLNECLNRHVVKRSGATGRWQGHAYCSDVHQRPRIDQAQIVRSCKTKHAKWDIRHQRIANPDTSGRGQNLTSLLYPS